MKKIVGFTMTACLLVSLVTKSYCQADFSSPDGISKISIAHISILVKDYEEALRFYTKSLGFEKKIDFSFGSQRFLTIAPAGQKEVEFVLVKPSLPEDKLIIGKQAGTRTLIVLNTNDCRKVIEGYKSKGVIIIAEPVDMAWGTQALFQDLYGNQFVLLQQKDKR